MDLATSTSWCGIWGRGTRRATPWSSSRRRTRSLAVTLCSRTTTSTEEADAAELPRRLEELAALPASRFIPGHGPPGGREILFEQAWYHIEVARMVRSAASSAAARAGIEAFFPAFDGARGERPTWP